MTRRGKSWGARAPKRVTERREQAERCGLRRCYLGGDANHPLYPICPKGSCRPTCQGIRAAFLRARLNKDAKVRRKAEARGARKRCM